MVFSNVSGFCFERLSMSRFRRGLRRAGGELAPAERISDHLTCPPPLADIAHCVTEGRTTSAATSFTVAKRLSPEVRGRVDPYLLRIDAVLTQHGATPFQRRSVASEIRQRILDRLAARGPAATAADAEAVIAELGPPENHIAAANKYPASPAPVASAPKPAAAPTSPVSKPETALDAPPAPTVPARISLVALLGAAWSLLVLIAVVVTLLSSPDEGETTPPWLMLVWIVGGTAPIGTTVLGLLAIGQIQRSQGRLYGLSLALFDAVIFPLLALDAVIFWICFQIADTLMQQGNANEPIIRLIREIVPTVAVILADYFLVVQAWAAVQPPTRRART
jgi:hypothetical protein